MAGASGLYLASYSAGGLSGSAALGQIFVRFGWPACAAGIGLGLLQAAYTPPACYSACASRRR
jgi:YNFM family putative membrane transporter